MNLTSNCGSARRHGRNANLVKHAGDVQVAIALVLLVGAGLLLASFRAVMHLDSASSRIVWPAAVNLPGRRRTRRRSSRSSSEASRRFARCPTSKPRTTLIPFSGNINNNVIMAEGVKPGDRRSPAGHDAPVLRNDGRETGGGHSSTRATDDGEFRGHRRPAGPFGQDRMHGVRLYHGDRRT
jgi:hypothetical protein